MVWSRFKWTWIAIVATLSLWYGSSFLQLESMWGINSLMFVPGWAMLLAVLAGLWILYLMIAPGTGTSIESRTAPIFRWMSDHSTFVSVGLCGVAGVVFWTFRTHSHFLGDGHTLLTNYGFAGAFIGSPTAPLATVVIRAVELLQDAGRGTNLEMTFQILSVVSGMACVYNFSKLSELLCTDPTKRFLTLFALCSSGSLLLFFGYVEYYPLLWAGATSCLLLSVRYLKTGRGFWPALLAYPLVIAIHIEGFILAAGIPILVSQKFPGLSGRFGAKSRAFGLIATLALGVAALTWVRSRNVAVGVLTLPWFVPEGKGGVVFSLEHFRDIVNLIFSIVPGVLVLGVWLFQSHKLPSKDKIQSYLGLVSLGGGAFLLVANPALGMARDWDLMSITLLPPLLLLLAIVANNSFSVSRREVLGAMTVTVMLTVFFLGVTMHQTQSEYRFASLLRVYGDRNRGGWTILERFYENTGEKARADALKVEIADVFRTNGNVDQGIALLELRRYNEAIELGNKALRHDRFDASAMILLGNAFLSLGEGDRAIEYLATAVQLTPFDLGLKNLLGQAYLKANRPAEALDVFSDIRRFSPRSLPALEGMAMAHILAGRLETAAAVADTMLESDNQSAGAHLVKLVIAVRRGRPDAGESHYREFRLYGRERADYAAVIETFGRFVEPRADSAVVK